MLSLLPTERASSRLLSIRGKHHQWPLNSLATFHGPDEAKMTLSSLKNALSAPTHPCMSVCSYVCSLATFEGNRGEMTR